MIGLRIASLRKKKGLSQDQLAKQINVCASAIGMYEQGRREPPIKTLVTLAQVFEVSLDYLITGSYATNPQEAETAGLLLILQKSPLNSAIPILLSEIDLGKIMTILQATN